MAAAGEIVLGATLGDAAGEPVAAQRDRERVEIARLIDGLARDGKIARLSGVCVFVVGAGLDPGGRS